MRFVARILWCVGFGAWFFVSAAESSRWRAEESGRSAPVVVPAKGPRETGFSLLGAAATGIAFTNQLAEQRVFPNHNLLNGSGVAIGDFDGDGWCDIYLCNLDGSNALYRNLGGWKFQDVTAAAGVATTNQNGTGAVFADVNGDGRLDIVATSLGGPNSLFINQGGGKFADVAASAGITSRYGATTAALADVDGNGTLDLYIANYGATSIIRSGGALNVSYVNGQPVVRGRYAQRVQIIGGTMFELGEPDALYLNDGTGKFKAVSWTDGSFLDEDGKGLKEAPWDQGLSAMFRDVNGDRAPDLYVCNDAFTPDRFWINDGKGKFRAMHRLKWRSTSHFSMGVDFADFDRDGDDDLFVLDMHSREHRYRMTQKSAIPPQPRAPGDLLTQIQMRRNTFYENRGDGSFAEIANLAGVAGSEWSWNPVFMDVDLDGWEDLLVSNGFPFNMDDLDTKEKVRTMGQLGVEQSRRTLLLFPKLATPNVAFRSNRNSTFSEAGAEWGFDSREVSNGFATGDLDNDGDLDVVVNTLNGPALIYRNESTAARIGVRLKGKAPNTQGIGARVTVRGGPVPQSQEIISGGRYVSGDDPMRVFACGDARTLKIDVVWRNGTRSVVEGAEANRIYEIDEASARPMSTNAAPVIAALFEDVSARVNHRHHETEFNDFEKQPSLPQRLSRPGPPVVWFDLDGNGWEDLIVGAGRGGKLEAFYNDGGKFAKAATGIIAPDDLSAIVAWRKSKEAAELILGVSNFETGGTNRLILVEARGTNFTETGTLKVDAAIGALALTRMGETMALFAGGKFVPGRFPEAAPSHLFLLRDGKWTEQRVAMLEKFGTVTGAIWSDLNQDGKAELLVACDWGSIHILEFADGTLVDRSKDWGMEEWVGRWQSVATGDFDGDGKMDFVGGNWGLNSYYNQVADGNVELFFGDYNGAGRIEMIEAHRLKDGRIVPFRDKTFFEQSLPWLAQAFPTHEAFAAAAMKEILGAHSAKGTSVRTRTLASMLFLNRERKFEAVALPREAQFTPVFGMAVADFDGDGFQDLALAQNFFGTREADGPLDAGRGLILRGGAGGKMKAMSGMESGVMAYGEQRGIAAVDFDKDGKVDLVIGQNGTETKVYRNKGR
jgi:enediyne biosynthesis protein E4